MEEGRLCANVIEAKINDVDVRYNKMKAGDESEDTEYEGGKVVPPERIISAAGFKVRSRAVGEEVAGPEGLGVAGQGSVGMVGSEGIVCYVVFKLVCHGAASAEKEWFLARWGLPASRTRAAGF